MVKRTIEYKNFNGVDVKEDYYFNFTEAELAKMQAGTYGGYKEMIERISNAKDIPAIASAFDEIILASYGEKSDDGKHFIKVRNGVRLAEEFSQTEAYSKLFIELAQDPKKFAEFVNGLIPESLKNDTASAAPIN